MIFNLLSIFSFFEFLVIYLIHPAKDIMLNRVFLFDIIFIVLFIFLQTRA